MPSRSVPTQRALWWAAWLVIGLVSVESARLGVPGGEATQKSAVIIAWLIIVLRWRPRMPTGPLLAGYLLALLLVFSLWTATPFATMSTGSQLNAWVGLTFPLLAFFVPWDRIGVQNVVHAVAFGPLVSLIAGFGMQLVGFGPVVRPETYTGALRLQGGLVPAHLAMLTVVAVFACGWLVQSRRRVAIPMLAVNCGILVATQTRGAIIVAVLFVSILVFFTSAGRGYRLLALGMVVGAAWLAVPLLRARTDTLTGSESAGFNSSGRLDAWEYWIEQTRGYEWTGRGLGASLEVLVNAPTGRVNSSFVVPHNMYLQFWLELGFLGCLLLVAALVLIWRWLRSGVPSNGEPLLRCIGPLVLLYSIVDNTLVTPQFTVPMVMLLSALICSAGETSESDHGGSGQGVSLMLAQRHQQV